MRIAGIDIGSRSMELVLREPDAAAGSGWSTTLQRRLPTTFDPVRQCRALLEGCEPDRIVSTGYGRALVQDLGFAAPVETVTEIRAHALAACHLFPQARTVLDIGGQDTKAISVLAGGKVGRFEMNDRCAAGTGKFLEYTATVFQMDVASFGSYAMLGKDAPVINSMCTVFAETEATSLMAQGVKPESIALGLHQSIVRRTMNMLRRIGLEFPLVFAGGVANNPCIRELLRRELGTEQEALLIPEEPDMCGALGAALWGAANAA
ncbi:acyl-CoA dehydratase activase [Desulfovibrio mangrovi]|uniref:acyl-CoA dehydratase activase n=1 Tax=Desulfovibrio mangrovi TaxID=2976983 RepID=UPI0022458D21|nr:acyl-CoA dehydratase activase [Desulfovibrio mangrovi]UZP66307.1 acyl-CoA dehydratase activase [Desulfovibrio mangrovi]